MNLLVLDGNSIVNRAFYGIKLLTTKSGYYTNAIYGFLNILLKLQDTCHPDGVAVAFDVHEPTFRHKQYADYKAGRKPMPQELRAQMPVLKELLIALGYTTVECPGWEAQAGRLRKTPRKVCVGSRSAVAQRAARHQTAGNYHLNLNRHNQQQQCRHQQNARDVTRCVDSMGTAIVQNGTHEKANHARADNKALINNDLVRRHELGHAHIKKEASVVCVTRG